MDKELIEKAASKYAAGEITKSRIERANRAFIAGAEWRINSVFHPVTEMPDRRWVVVETYNKTAIPYIGIDIKSDWVKFVNEKECKSWAYLEDLLPDVYKLDSLKVREQMLVEEIDIEKMNGNDTDNGRKRQ